MNTTIHFKHNDDSIVVRTPAEEIAKQVNAGASLLEIANRRNKKLFIPVESIAYFEECS